MQRKCTGVWKCKRPGWEGKGEHGSVLEIGLVLKKILKIWVVTFSSLVKPICLSTLHQTFLPSSPVPPCILAKGPRNMQMYALGLIKTVTVIIAHYHISPN
jgi:hypothetical protein